jgi:hypothetical protein
MPNKIRTGIKLKTRSQRALDKENNPVAENTQTPQEVIAERKKNYKPNKFADRKYFSVSEDWNILETYNAQKLNMSTRDISDLLAESMTHTSESIRDRIKRYISKLSILDAELLKEEAEVRFNFRFTSLRGQGKSLYLVPRVFYYRAVKVTS